MLPVEDETDYSKTMKNLKRISLAALSVAIVISLQGQTADYNVIPLPDKINVGTGSPFVLDAATTLEYSECLQREADFLKEYVARSTGIAVASSRAAAGNRVVLLIDRSLGAEEYSIKVADKTLMLVGGSSAGVFYAVQTLRKSLPVGSFESVALPPVAISDSPRFAYRGMMLDVSRHFFGVDFVKEYLDILALHNINKFHWHLTDDQGWRIEIKRYPLLASVGSRRSQTVIGRNSSRYDGKPYGEGCLFSQDQIREIVAYAAERHIEVIPEIDMPGHMIAALTAYPELGCTGGPYEVWTRWGVSEDLLCAGNDSTIEFAKGVLTEVMELFPSKYIHIGGDECPKNRWAECPKCRRRIESEHLTDDTTASSPEEALQGWVMRSISDFLGKNGRTVIGWDEILETGNYDDNTMVMSWRGAKGGKEAAKRGINAIMVPNDVLYFDYYQTREVEREPLAIGGCNPIEKVYAFEPTMGIPANRQKYIVGVQANLWTEYVLSERHVEHMVLPRMAALCEVQWRKSPRDNYDGFLDRVRRQLVLYERLGYNYAPYLLDVKCDFTPSSNGRAIEVKLSTIDGAAIRYTLNGTLPTTQSPLYNSPVSIDRTATLSAAAFRANGVCDPMTVNLRFSLSTLCDVKLLNNPSPSYTYGGAATLVDGLSGNKNYRTGRWIGFYGNDCVAVVDLNSAKAIESVDFGVCVNKDDGCFDSRGVRVEISDNGLYFKSIASADYAPMTEADDHGVYHHTLKFERTSARFVKVTILAENNIPDWHPYAAGQKAFLFVDEIDIE